MIQRNTTESFFLKQFPHALHLMIPFSVRSTRTEFEAQLCESLHFDGVKAGTLPRLATDELVVHASLGKYPAAKFGTRGGGHVAVAVFVLCEYECRTLCEVSNA